MVSESGRNDKKTRLEDIDLSDLEKEVINTLKSRKKNEIELLHLHFSEYNYFMWCERCNIDIPSYLCLSPISKGAIEIYTKRFLGMVKNIKERAIKEYCETKQKED